MEHNYENCHNITCKRISEKRGYEKAETDIIERLESERIDVDSECAYCDPTGALEKEYRRANEMLDDCIYHVRRYFEEENQS